MLVPNRLNEVFIPTVPPKVPVNNYGNTVKAAGTVFTIVTAWVVVMNLAMDQLMKAGFLTFVGAPDSDKQYKEFIKQLEDQGVINPELTTSADELAEGRWQITLHGTPTEVSQDFFKYSLIAGGCILAVIAGLIVAAHCYGYTNGFHPVLDDVQKKVEAHEKAIEMYQRLQVSGNPPIQSVSSDNGEPKYLFRYWDNYAGNDAEKVKKTSYQIIFSAEKFFQATVGFWKALGISFCLELTVLLIFNKHLESIGEPVFNAAIKHWAETLTKNESCIEPNGTAEQCLGEEGLRAAQEEARAIVVERLSDQRWLFAGVLIAAIPLMYYFAKLIYNTSSAQCKINSTAAVVPSHPLTSNYATQYSVVSQQDNNGIDDSTARLTPALTNRSENETV